jgi:hypothetical protein
VLQTRYRCNIVRFIALEPSGRELIRGRLGMVRDDSRVSSPDAMRNKFPI